MAFGKCIICGNSSDGALVEDTRTIQTIRAIKMRLNMAQNNTLVVCPSCTETHAKKRKNFEGKLTFNIAIGVGIILLLVVLPPLLGGTFNISSLLFAPLLAILIIALPMLDYVPPLAKGEAGASGKIATPVAKQMEPEPIQVAMKKTAKTSTKPAAKKPYGKAKR